jgi:hypothetical protein
MGTKEVFVNGALKIEVKVNNGTITVNWTGKSIDRKPDKFISPILVDVCKLCSNDDKRIILDFCKLDYMNSSTITPIIKILERAKRGTAKITIHYDGSLKWQDLNFSALEIFRTRDKRIEIIGIK